MPPIDRWRDVLDENMRAVWPHLAAAIRGTDGRLMGGTAVAMHLRHRTSDDLDVMTLAPFPARSVANSLRSAFPDSYEESEIASNTVDVHVNAVKVQVFRALPQETDPEDMTWLTPGPVMDGMPVGSLPDLFATKLDVIMYRPQLRDYIDIAALDRASGHRIEDGLTFWARRFGRRIQSRAADRIVNLLEDPGHLPPDRDFGDVRGETLGYLNERAGEVRRTLGALRSGHTPDTDGPELHPKRTRGGMLPEPHEPQPPGPHPA